VPRGFDAKPIHNSWAAEFAGTFRKPGVGMLKAAMKNHGVWTVRKTAGISGIDRRMRKPR